MVSSVDPLGKHTHKHTHTYTHTHTHTHAQTDHMFLANFNEDPAIVCYSPLSDKHTHTHAYTHKYMNPQCHVDTLT